MKRAGDEGANEGEGDGDENSRRGRVFLFQSLPMAAARREFGPCCLSDGALQNIEGDGGHEQASKP